MNILWGKYPNELKAYLDLCQVMTNGDREEKSVLLPIFTLILDPIFSSPLSTPFIYIILRLKRHTEVPE